MHDEVSETRSEQLQWWLSQAEQLMMVLRQRLATEEIAEHHLALRHRINELADDIAHAEQKWVQLTAKMYSGESISSYLYLQFATAHIKAGNFELALASYNRAIQQAEQPLAEAYIQRAETYAQVGRWKEALDDYNQAEHMVFPGGRFLIGRAIALYRLKRFEQAEGEFLRALPPTRENADTTGELLILNYLGAIATLRGQLDKALQYYDAAVEIGETIADSLHLADLYYNRANLLVKQGRESAALKDYERAIWLAPGNADAYQSVALLYRNRRDLDKADQYQSMALELESNRPDFLANMGTIQLQRRNYEEAHRLYQQSLDLGWSEADVYDGLGTGEMALGNFSVAEAAFRRALELRHLAEKRQGEEAILGNMVNIHLRLAEYSKAIEHSWQTLDIGQKMGGHQSEEVILGNMVNVYLRLTEYSKVIGHSWQTLDIGQKIGEHQSEEVILGNIFSALERASRPSSPPGKLRIPARRLGSSEAEEDSRREELTLVVST